MELLQDTLKGARAAADAARAAHEKDGPRPGSAPIDLRAEFGDKLQELAEKGRALAEGLSDGEADPLSVIAGLQKLATDTESLAVRYRKVDLGESEAMRKKALEILYGQPEGVSQLIRDLASGVYETGNATCLPVVARLLDRTYDLQEQVGRTIYG